VEAASIKAAKAKAKADRGHEVLFTSNQERNKLEEEARMFQILIKDLHELITQMTS